MIGGQTYDNTEIQIQEGSNLGSRVSLGFGTSLRVMNG